MKECPQCGKRYSDNDKFCQICGAGLMEEQPAPEASMEEQPAPQPPAPGYQMAPPVKEKKKGAGKLGIAVVAVAVLALGVSGIMGRNGSGSHGGVVYLSDDQYYVSEKGEKDKSIALPFGSVYDPPTSSAVQFSPEGDYVYYLGDYDDYMDSGTLWRCQYKKLGKDSSKNEKYCEEIDTGVCSGFFPSKDGVVYKTEENELKYFDGKDTHDFGKISNFYQLKGENRIAYEVENDDSGYSLYGVELKKPDEKLLLAEQYASFRGMADFDHILYITEMDDIGGDYNDDECAVYVTGFGKEPEKIGQGDYDTIYAYRDMAYQVEENGTEIKTSDLFKGNADTEELVKELEEELVGGSTYKTLYAYKDGKIFVVSDKIMTSLKMGNGLLYVEANQLEIPDSFSTNKDTFLDEMEEHFQEMLFDSCLFFYSPVAGKSVQIPYETYQSMENADTKAPLAEGGEISISETSAILRFPDAMYGAKIEDGKVLPFTDDLEGGFLSNWDVNDQALYYWNNMQRENGVTFYEMYSYENGESSCILKKTMNGAPNMYKDGSILGYTDYIEDGKYTATFLDNKGKSYEIGTGNSFIRTGEKQFLFIQDGNLCKYEKGKTEEIAGDVDTFWSQDTMELSSWEMVGK